VKGVQNVQDVQKIEDNKRKVKAIIQNDRLYDVIKDTPLENDLYLDDYLSGIIEKKYYSTPEIAEWFGINDGQLRYYIKPFQDYIFEEGEDTPNSSTAYRLNFKSILKLRMIILLKDEYRVKGLKRLLGLDGYGFVEKRTGRIGQRRIDEEYEDDSSDRKKEAAGELIPKKQMDLINQILNNKLLSTGFFELAINEDGEQQVVIKPEYTTSQIQMPQNVERLESIEEKLKKLEKEREKDITIRLRENMLFRKVERELQAEAITEWVETHKMPFWCI
jgi:DNA-binding transcriptional MerR regulator